MKTNILAAIAIILLANYALTYLWNDCLVPAVSVLREVSYWQMLGILILIKTLNA